ncbi:hypothetical protein FS837_005251 [Tulasnella sp. UAMH 9824]|nr:hypothetical protein FS837_005251 [Tulasnella sp. UAMH 9824]
MRPSDSVCYIRSLPNELLEKILLELIGLGSSSHSWNEYIVGELAKVCQRWAAVASRLALVNVRVEAQYSSDKVIERAYKLSKAQGGWTPTQVLQVSHDSLEGPLYRFAELVQLFGRTVDTLKVHCRPGYDDKASEGSFPPAIVGTIFFPMLRTLSLSEISPATAQECLRNVDPTKLRDMNLNLTIEPSPAEGYLNGIVFPQLEHLELRVRLVGGTTFDDLKTATPALKSLEIEISNTRMSEFVAHMRSKWPGMLKHLDLTVRGRDKSVTSHHPAVREFLGLAKEKGVESFDMYVAEGSESWELSMRQEPQNDE